MFPQWDISECIINTAFLGDSIAAFRLVISGKLVTEVPAPHVCLYTSTIDQPTSRRRHINGCLNEDCFSITRVHRYQWYLASYQRDELLPYPLAIGKDTLITSADVVLHPDYPGIEGESRNIPLMDCTSFLVLYPSQDGSCWCVQPFSCGEILSMYTPHSRQSPYCSHLSPFRTYHQWCMGHVHTTHQSQLLLSLRNH